MRPIRPRHSFNQALLYHIVNKGNNGHRIFHSMEDGRFFVRLCHKLADRHKVELTIVDVMPNHFHILLQPAEDADVSAFMRDVCGQYSKYYNKKYSRTGQNYDGRFRCREVANADYAREVIRYIALNPVKGKLCNTPEEWPLSSYHQLINVLLQSKSQRKVVAQLFGSVEFLVSYVNEKRDVLHAEQTLILSVHDPNGRSKRTSKSPPN